MRERDKETEREILRISRCSGMNTSKMELK